MFCCFPPSRRSKINAQNDEKKPLLTSHTTAFSYQTILSIPYAHVIRDDKLSIDSSNVVEKNVTDTFLLFNTALPDQAYETACFSFDDADVSTPVVFATTTADGHILFERLFQIEHVTAINPSTTIRMSQIDQTKPISSSNISMARPFDEFPTDAQSDSNTTKPD